MHFNKHSQGQGMTFPCRRAL